MEALVRLTSTQAFCALLYLIHAVACLAHAEAISPAEQKRWQNEAENTTIVRDTWGIAHVHGKTDADAVFGMEYAQAEDDFGRVETNNINALGRLAEAEGESKIFQDLRMKIFVDPEKLQTLYRSSPLWLQRLMVAFADGLNFYLSKHPEVKPRVITRFEPWMALAFSEGSIGGDIEQIDLKSLEDFYGAPTKRASTGPLPPLFSPVTEEAEPGGSNGIAIAPSNTAEHHALLLINPHTSFYFRSELQVSSDEGLNAYGAVTWGQFFIYQGFNEHAGWMHTSSGVDAIDQYLETVSQRDGHYRYKYGSETRPVMETRIVVPYKTSAGMAQKTFTVYRTHHGPVIASADGKWISIRLMQKPLQALVQSYSRTKAKNYAEFRHSLDLHANSSNNTIFADAEGNIAYLHANFIPRRDERWDWTKPVDGSTPETEWHELLSVEQLPHVLNPKSGWVYNVNNAPWSAAGADSPKRENYPKYIENGRESARGLHAIRILADQKDWTLDSLTAAAYDSYLPWFEKTIPVLYKAWNSLPESDVRRQDLQPAVDVLGRWDFRWGVDSVATSVAVMWAEELRQRYAKEATGAGLALEDFVSTRLGNSELIQALANSTTRLKNDFGSWNTPWGEINRFQRLTDTIESQFDDSKPSIPVGFTASAWGSLAAFGAHQYPNTKKWYGNVGNSFVAVVEFGPKVRARAVTAGGESGDLASKHFKDQEQRYSTGDLREVYFYPEQVQAHAERTYHPGN
jgi:acyl-homoserine-lactone acylase